MNSEILYESVNSELEKISDKWKIFNLRKSEVCVIIHLFFRLIKIFFKGIF